MTWPRCGCNGVDATGPVGKAERWSAAVGCGCSRRRQGREVGGIAQWLRIQEVRAAQQMEQRTAGPDGPYGWVMGCAVNENVLDFLVRHIQL